MRLTLPLSVLLTLAAPALALAQVSAAESISSQRRAASFRPTPLRGQSQIPGRSLGLREQMNQNRIFLLSPATSPVSSVASLRRQAAESLARIRASQTRSRQLAALAMRQAATPQRAAPSVSHQLELAFEPIDVPPEFTDAQDRARARRFDGVRERLSLPDVRIELVEGRAVLWGRASDPRAVRRLEQVLLLEPGIHAVENRLSAEPLEPTP